MARIDATVVVAGTVLFCVEAAETVLFYEEAYKLLTLIVHSFVIELQLFPCLSVCLLNGQDTLSKVLAGSSVARQPSPGLIS